MDEMKTEWHNENEARTEAWAEVNSIHLRISQCDKHAHWAGKWHWQVSSIENLDINLSGIEDTRELAIEMATMWARRGVNAICDTQVSYILGEIEGLVEELERVDPENARKLAGFGTGYMAGINAAREALGNLCK